MDSPLVSRSASQRWFRRFAGLLLGYLLFVIVFGAWVRITGSGAGCGAHWPTCQGVILPRSPSQATVIEYTHRLTSGLLGLLALALPVWAFRSFGPGHGSRRWSLGTLALVAVEAAIGAGLVKYQLVADDASLARAVAVALHLVNTLLLTACAALTVACAGSEPLQYSRRLPPSPPGMRWLLGALLLGLVLVAASGAVTALGDTLFPVPASAGAPTLPAAPEHFLVQLRVVHPILACLVVCLALGAARLLARPPTWPWAVALGGLALLELLVGGANILLGAPGWLQLCHLLLAQLLWISAVLAVRGSLPQA